MGYPVENLRVTLWVMLLDLLEGRQIKLSNYENGNVANKRERLLVIGVIVFLCRDIHMPEKVKEAMQLMVAAERKKRAAITESEGKRASEINVAEGVKQVHLCTKLNIY